MMQGRRVSLSLFPFQGVYGDIKALEIAGEVGVDAVDFCLTGKRFDVRNPESVYSRTDEEIAAYFADIKKTADALGVVICMTHGHLEGFKQIEEEDAALLENIRRDLLATKILGAPVCVLHGVTTIHMGPDCDPQLMRDLNFHLFTQVLPYAREYDVKIATETFGNAACYGVCDFFGNIDEFIKTFNRICAAEDFRKYFTICVDTGHSNLASRYNANPSPADVIRMLGGSISTLHLHDNDTYTDQHKIPMTGTIDWEDVFDALDEVGYSGYYNMELSLKWFGRDMMRDSAAFAVKVMKHFLKKRYNTKGETVDG